MISYCIIDDHKATRRMIEQIIEDAMLGTVVVTPLVDLKLNWC